jgi:hypothetical protein
MKYTKHILSLLILLTIALSLTPAATPQIGTYTFHGAAGNEKVLKVRTVNNASLTDLFGSNWTDVIELFGTGAQNVGARSKSLVTAVNLTAKYDLSIWGVGVQGVAEYNTSNWDWTTGSFAANPDSTGDIVRSFYDPTNLTTFINTFYSYIPPYIAFNVSVQNAGLYLAQLPTPVAQYLGAIVWMPKWQNVGNTVEHNAAINDYIFGTTFQYLEACKEVWTYDATYGAWIGYKILDNTGAVIYEFSIELPAIPAIPGFEIPILLGAAAIGIIYIIKKRK